MYSTQAALLAGLLTIASCSPITLESRGLVKTAERFTIHQDAEKLPGRKLAGPIALAGIYDKYSTAVPQVVAAAAQKAASDNDGTVEAAPEEYDSEYLSPVNVGGTILQLDFDTGSADLWVFSSELSTTAQQGHSIYNPRNSRTAKKLGTSTWSITYGDGSGASGIVYTDTVNIGGTVVQNQAVELADTVSAQFLRDNSDGLVGLSFSSGNQVRPRKQKTFFDNAIPSLESPLFTCDLKRGTTGSYDFGFIDDSKYTGEITYTAVDNSQGFWGFTASGFAVGDAEINNQEITAIADTGTSLMALPDSVVSAYWDSVDGAKLDEQQGGYTFPCRTTLPDFSLQIEGYTAVVPGIYLNYAPISRTTCFGGLQSDGDIGISILGDVFLKSQFVVFSNDGPQLGFAAKNL